MDPFHDFIASGAAPGAAPTQVHLTVPSVIAPAGHAVATTVEPNAAGSVALDVVPAVVTL